MNALYFLLIFLAATLGAPALGFALDYVADIALTVSEQYNDNIYLAHSNKTSDFITAVMPTLAISTRSAAFDVSANYSPTFSLYKDNTGNNGISHRGTVLGHYKPTDRLTFGLSDTFVKSRESTIVRTVEGAGPITRGIEQITTNTVNGDIDYRLSQRFSLFGNANYTVTSTQAGTGDVSTYTGGLGVRYIFNERTTFRINATYTFFNYKLSSDATSSSYIAGVNYKLTPTIVVDAYGGIIMTQVKTPARTDDGMAVGLSVTKTLEHGTASISYMQSVTAGVESSVPIDSKTISLRYAAPVTTRSNASLTAFYSIFRAVGQTGISTTDLNRDDLGGSASLSYRLLPWLDAILSYTYVDSQDKTNRSGSYTNNLIMISLRLFKQMRF